MLYFQRTMKKFIRPFLILVISSLLLFLSVAFNASRPVRTTQLKQYTGAMITFQITITPEPLEKEDQSVVGSTDGITVMSFVIAAIILFPIILKRRSWDSNIS